MKHTRTHTHTHTIRLERNYGKVIRMMLVVRVVVGEDREFGSLGHSRRLAVGNSTTFFVYYGIYKTDHFHLLWASNAFAVLPKDAVGWCQKGLLVCVHGGRAHS